MYEACKNGDKDTVMDLIQAGFDLNTDLSAFDSLFDDYESDDEIVTRGAGFLAIHVASFYGRGNLIHTLVESGADVNAFGFIGTPLFWACEKVHTSVVILLLENGADVNAKNNDGATTMHVVLNAEKSFDYVDYAEENGVMVMQSEHTAEVTEDDIAKSNSTREILSILVEWGIDLNVIDKVEKEIVVDMAYTNEKTGGRMIGITQLIIDAGCNLYEPMAANPFVQKILADNAMRRDNAEETLQNIGFGEYVNLNDFLDFLFLPKELEFMNADGLFDSSDDESS